MLRSFILFVLLSSFFVGARAQELEMPRNIQKAYTAGTRSADGKPGKNYWQNNGRYDISITAMPPGRNIKGTEHITYLNNSPDTLKQLNIKLILNIHRRDAARVRSTTADYYTPGMQIDTFKVSGSKVNWDNNIAHTTNQFVSLQKPLAPHDSVKLDIAWHFEVSQKSDREGMIDSTSYYLAYFYPRVAVYDDYTGWDRLEFLDFQEFYNDFNDYTLRVTVPKNFIVWSTGTLQNPDEVLQPEYIKRLNESMRSDSTIHIADAQDIAGKNITAPNNTNTWIWEAHDISDVALGISDHYNWDAASVVVDDATHRRVSVQAAFLDESEDFHQAVKFAHNSLDFFSHKWPGVPYPFPKTTTFQGYADMEYPMMVNDNHYADAHEAQFTQDHEIAHTYFPFYMGTNESRWAFMDEGWATTFELLINTQEVGAMAAENFFKHFRVIDYAHDNSSTERLPIITPSNELRDGYSSNSYVKPSLSYLALKDMLGDDLFKKALHTYMDNWNGKHPIPWDYFNSMNAGTGKNLNWFFKNWFFTHNYIDLALQDVIRDKDGYKLEIKNVGGFAVPFNITILYTDGSTENIHQTPAVWKTDQKKLSVFIKTGNKRIQAARLDGGIFMDADEENNVWPEPPVM